MGGAKSIMILGQPNSDYIYIYIYIKLLIQWIRERAKAVYIHSRVKQSERRRSVLRISGLWMATNCLIYIFVIYIFVVKEIMQMTDLSSSSSADL